MVGGQRHAHEGADHHLAVLDDDLGQRRRDGQDGGLRRVDDGGEVLDLDASRAHVGDGERPRAHVLRLELVLARALTGRLGLLRQLRQRLLLRVLDDRRQQPIGQRHSDADVDRCVAGDALVADRHVDFGVAHQGVGDGLDDQVVDRQLDPLAFEQLVHLLAPRQRLGHVHRDGHEEVRAGGHALLQPLPDDLAHAAPGCHLAGGSGSRSRSGSRGGCGGWGGRGSGRRRGRRWGLGRGGGLRRGGSLLGSEVVLDIQLDDAATGAGALHLAQVNVVVLGDTAGDGGGLDPTLGRFALPGGHGRVALRLVTQRLPRFTAWFGLGRRAGR